MQDERTVEETDEAATIDEVEEASQCPAVAQKILGWIIAAILIFLAQRDLRKRPSELVRGRVGIWKAVAMAPPGAVVYLLLGRRRTAPPATTQMPMSIDA